MTVLFLLLELNGLSFEKRYEPVKGFLFPCQNKKLKKLFLKNFFEILSDPWIAKVRTQSRPNQECLRGEGEKSAHASEGL